VQIIVPPILETQLTGYVGTVERTRRGVVYGVRFAMQAGEMAEYYPIGTIANRTTAAIAHIGGLDGTGVRCTIEARKRDYPEYHAQTVAQETARRERLAVNDYAGDGLDARWEDASADICGR